ncbi:MAG: CRTAC1 family protein [Deltaproteobacteria bacterium]|nr:MAG: CRTAC1 family protein [Deltaproteobacteria bacterium]
MPAPAAPAAQPADTLTKNAAQLTARLHDAIEGDAALTAINTEEAAYRAVVRDVLRPWSSAWTAKDGAAFGQLLAADARGTSWSAAPQETVRTLDGVTETRITPSPATDLAADVAAYLGAFAKVEDVSLYTLRFVAAEGAKATLTIRYDVRGVLADGARRNDRGELSVSVAEADGRWRLAEVSATRAESVSAAASHTPTFADATSVAGLDSVPVTSRAEALRRGGYAMAVADYDGDRRPDVLLGHYGRSQLLRNTGDGFEDVTEKAGLRGDTLVKAAAFADLDNDGHRDLLLLRFTPDASDAGQPGEPCHDRQGVCHRDLVAYRNNGDGTFAFKGDVLTRYNEYDQAMPLAVADFDNNGFLDVYIGFPGARDFTNNLAVTGRENKLAANGVWLNDGQWNFTEIPSKSGGFPHAAMVSDLDRDGDPDLVVVDDSGLESQVYLNDGKGKMTEGNAATGIHIRGFAMAAAQSDFDGDGRLDVTTTAIDLSDGHRLAASWLDRTEGKLHDALAELDRGLAGNLLFKSTGAGFEDVTAEAGLGFAGEAPAGVNFVDYNGDGHPDIYVSNGLWSGAGDQELSSLFVRSLLRGEETPIFKSGDDPTAMSGPNPVLDILREFKGDLAQASGPAISDAPTLTMAGYERNRLFRNNGDGTFTEVGYLEGADRIEDGYVVAAADFDGDGRQDLMLRNCDPAPGVHFKTVTLLKNQGEGFHTLTVFARGAKSNADGIGALVTATVGGRQIVRPIESTNGAIQGEPVAYFGLGAAARVDRLEVRWPSGLVESFDGVASGIVRLDEGKGMVALAGR